MSSVWNVCHWVANVPPSKTSPVAKSVEKRMFSQATTPQTLFEIQTRDVHTPLPSYPPYPPSLLEGLLYITLTLRLLWFCLLAGGNPQPTMSEAFLSNCVFMTYKWFLSSEELLKKFMQRYPWLYESKVGSFFFYHDKNIVLMFVHVKCFVVMIRLLYIPVFTCDCYKIITFLRLLFPLRIDSCC